MQHRPILRQHIRGKSAHAISPAMCHEQSQQMPANVPALEIIVDGDRNFGGLGIREPYVTRAAHKPSASTRFAFSHNAKLVRRINREHSPQFFRREAAQRNEESMQQRPARRRANGVGNQRLIFRRDRTKGDLPSVGQSE